jgi:hypothetical protein
LIFQRKGNAPFFGCELEIKFNNFNDIYDCKSELFKINKENFTIVNDMSIGSQGFEIITNVFGYAEMIFLFKQILKIVTKYNGKCDSACGLHIHIDKTPEIEKKIKELFNCININTIELIGLRSLNDYCKMNTNKWSKYHVVNIEGHVDTIEFRFFRCKLILKNIILLNEDELKNKYCIK